MATNNVKIWKACETCGEAEYGCDECYLCKEEADERANANTLGLGCPLDPGCMDADCDYCLR